MFLPTCLLLFHVLPCLNWKRLLQLESFDRDMATAIRTKPLWTQIPLRLSSVSQLVEDQSKPSNLDRSLPYASSLIFEICIQQSAIKMYHNPRVDRWIRRLLLRRRCKLLFLDQRCIWMLHNLWLTPLCITHLIFFAWWKAWIHTSVITYATEIEVAYVMTEVWIQAFHQAKKIRWVIQRGVSHKLWSIQIHRWSRNKSLPWRRNSNLRIQRSTRGLWYILIADCWIQISKIRDEA